MIALQIYLLLLVSKAAFIIRINIHDLTIYAVTFLTIVAPFRTLFIPIAQLATRNDMLWVDIDQSMSAWTLGIDIGYDFSRSRLIKFLRQVRIAGLAYSEIAMIIIIYSIITHSSTNTTYITYIIQISYSLKVELMS